MSRIQYTTKNMVFGYVQSISSMILGFISRTVFIYTLGSAYLGVNGLFTNVLGVLSFAELGIGTAMNYSLYKPVAEQNTERIKSLMKLYKTAYRVIALVVTVIGFALLPFLNYIVKDPGDIGNISLYYLIFLFNTVTSYLVSYKFSLVNAEQKNYIFSVVNTIVTVVTTVAQVVSLLLFRNFFIYLLVAAVIGLAQKLFISRYLNRLYPFLLEEPKEKLPEEEFNSIKKNVFALIWHKIGDIAVHQSDIIIISSFINVSMAGIISNYNLVISAINGLVGIAMNSVIGSLGNLIATESDEKQYRIFKTYRFVTFWLYGFSSVAYLILFTPLITLWIGPNMLIDNVSLLLIVLNNYLLGHRICINNLKSAGGVFQQDKFVALAQAIVNIAVSIGMVKLVGLPGVYIGTVVQGLISTIIKPVIVYREIFHQKAKYYFIDGTKYFMTVVAAAAVCIGLKTLFLSTVSIGSFVCLILLTAIVPNFLFFLVYRKNECFLHVTSIIKLKLRREQIHE